jgi:hypothetical protein
VQYSNKKKEKVSKKQSGKKRKKKGLGYEAGSKQK